MDCVIGIDLGTTGCKSTVFDETGAVLGESYIECPLIVISDREIEQDPDAWWELSKKAIRDAVGKAGLGNGSAKGRIRALSVSSQGISFVPVDSNCNPLCNALSWLDSRAEEQAARISGDFDEDGIYRITGKRISAVYVLPKLMWMKQERPHIYETAYKFLMGHDYLVAKMTGEYVTDHTMAGGTLMHDVNILSWNGGIIEKSGIDMFKLPEIKWSGEIAGKITTSAAKELGLDENVLVCVGAQDQKAAALGASLGFGNATVSLGTAGAIEMLTNAPVFDERKSIPCFAYTQKGQWVLEAVVGTAGASLKWCRNALFPDMSYADYDDLSGKSSPGSNGVFFYPHLAGATTPYWDADARGVFSGISLSAKRHDIARSVLEGIAFQLKANIVKAGELGAVIEGIRIFGGGSGSRIWCGMISNITGKKVTAFASPEIASLGAGILAARGAGMPVEGFGKRILDDRTDFEPDPGLNDRYERIFEKYISIEKAFVK